MKESVLILKEKQQHNIGVPTFKLPASTNNILWLTHQILFLTYDIWLLGYRLEFSFLYIPHGQYSIVLSGYKVQMNMYFLFWSKVHFFSEAFYAFMYHVCKF